MQENVDVVNIVQIAELATAVGVDLSWLLPVGRTTVEGSKKITIQSMATIISEQIGAVSVPDPIFYTPPGGEDTVEDELLDGADYTLFKWGVGPLKKGEDWQNDVVGGGFRLLGGEFTTGEVYAAFFKPQVSNILAAPGAIARFVSGITELTSSTTISAGNFRRLLVLRGAETVTLPLVTEYPVNIALFLVSDTGPRKQSTIVTQGGDVIRTQTGDLDTFYMGQREFITLITDGTYWYVQSCSPAIFGHPKLETGWLWDVSALNTLPATGGLYNRVEYPRLWAFIEKLAAAAPLAVVNEATWSTNKTRWGSGNGTSTFRVPDMRGYFARFMDLGADIDQDRFDAGTGSIPGVGQLDEFRIHNHTLDTRILTEAVPGPGPGGPTPGSSGVPPNTGNAGGTETRPINASFYPLIYI